MKVMIKLAINEAKIEGRVITMKVATCNIYSIIQKIGITV